MKRTEIKQLFSAQAEGWIDTTVNVKGWVRTKRGNKNVAFIALNDGSTINNIQIVVDLATADAAELPCIAVAWGFRGREKLEALGAARIVQTPQELAQQLLT